MEFINIIVDDVPVEIPLGCGLINVDIDQPGMIPFRCKQGICGTCRIQILEGGKHVTPPLDDELKFLKRLGHEDESIRLACQIKAFGSIKIRVCKEYKGKRKLY